MTHRDLTKLNLTYWFTGIVACVIEILMAGYDICEIVIRLGRILFKMAALLGAPVYHSICLLGAGGIFIWKSAQRLWRWLRERRNTVSVAPVEITI